MAKASAIDQTRYAMGVLTACLVKAMSEKDGGLQARFEEILTKAYKEIREEGPPPHTGVLETLSWTLETLKQL